MNEMTIMVIVFILQSMKLNRKGVRKVTISEQSMKLNQ